NLAIAVGGAYNYSLVRIDGGESIIASDMIEKVSKVIGAEKVERLGETTGDKLVGLQYTHPFCDRVGKIIAAPHVTLEDGTGLVHTAPGHGEEDWRAGRKEGLEAYCPVRDNGTYDDTVPEWLRGVSIWEANKTIWSTSPRVDIWFTTSCSPTVIPMIGAVKRQLFSAPPSSGS
ncbi:MAG: hypothetical protein EBQ71_00895, partial [Betaproteobacteria bacterium]|nr:hypothetical protein [Betaproteobacteria bacterium]